MVWTDIMLDSRTPLHVFERGSVTGVRGRDEVVEPYVHLFRGACGPQLNLMEDNAMPYRVLLVDEFLVRIFAVWIGQPGRQTSTLIGYV
ncbi:HTH_Tnp_Tc3_2 domain-containing protein [Trichonephila clavipes]|nr:HTH_Tnp_Tc3_2 domain-containing protein [Trichonephila clavipes]